MLITKTEDLSNSRTRVFIDGELAFVLYKGEFRSLKLKEGEEISEQTYNHILTELLPKRAKLRAMNLLQKKFYTVYELRKKLLDGDYPEEIVQSALDYVASFGYTDDLRFSEDYIRYHQSQKSRKRIELDLSAKGVSRDIIDEAFTSCEEIGLAGEYLEIEQIHRLAEKKHFNPTTSDYSERQRFFAFLVRKGYGMDLIRKAFDADYYCE